VQFLGLWRLVVGAVDVELTLIAALDRDRSRDGVAQLTLGSFDPYVWPSMLTSTPDGTVIGLRRFAT